MPLELQGIFSKIVVEQICWKRALFSAADDADAVTVQHVLSSAPAVGASQTKLAKALCLAVESNCSEIDKCNTIRVLLHNSADVNSSCGYTALQTACSESPIAFRTAIVRLLIDHNADCMAVSSKSSRKCSTPPLIMAMRAGHDEIAAILLEGGAEIGAVNKPDGDAETLLHHAARNGGHMIVQLLLSIDADHTLKDDNGFTALESAVKYGRGDRANNCIDTLVEAGAQLRKDVNSIVDKRNNKTLLHFAAKRHRSEVYESTTAVKLLLQQNADHAVQDTDGQTPLHIAVQWGSSNCVLLLIEARANVNAQDKKKRTPLHVCVDTHHWNSMDMPADGRTDTVARSLLEHRADLTIKDDSGETALDIAYSRSEPSEAQRYVQAFSKRKALESFALPITGWTKKFSNSRKEPYYYRHDGKLRAWSYAKLIEAEGKALALLPGWTLQNSQDFMDVLFYHVSTRESFLTHDEMSAWEAKEAKKALTARAWAAKLTASPKSKRGSGGGAKAK